MGGHEVGAANSIIMLFYVHNVHVTKFLNAGFFYFSNNFVLFVFFFPLVTL